MHQTKFTDWGEAIGASAAVHLAAAVLIFDLVGDIRMRAALPEERPQITVTSLILGGDTTTSSTDEGNGETTLKDPGDDALTPVAPVEPEALDPVAPDQTTPDDTDPTPPETVDPVAPDEIGTPIEPTILRPTDTGVTLGGATVRGEGATPVTPESIGAVERTPVINTTSPSDVPQFDGNGGTPTSGEMNELVRRIRAQLNDPCLVAIPTQTGDGTAELIMLGDTDTGMRTFAATVLDGLTPRPTERSILIDNRQCGALNYVRQSEAYPTFRLTVSLDEQTIASGSNLTGSIGNIGGRYVTLILIDDNGIVQELGEYLSFRGGVAEFDIPFTRAGVARDTSQILMAFGSAARPRTVDTQNGQLSNTYFTELQAELGVNTPLVMIPFEIR